ncbi:MAG: DUF4390 domain-containing protein [Candidatus Marinimicrobia bacterium]|nr:DUF4390 domain-containing protein [Candidatus Neomarinimicrobiota bacterium]MCF7851468.1 DUF4390 domain-containing protein [Candidatus Neomarinimicrobiota bacterium]MCF7904091.1 DUF4390 domain-containing protein [Candidatus Neomarinimicrobiota bacterium]
MLQFITDKLSAGALIVSQLLLTAVVGTDPYFVDVSLELRDERLMYTATLAESFTPDMDVLLQSGDTVTIHFELDLVNLQTDSVVAIADWEHQFLYSILEDEYTVYKTESDRLIHSYNFFEAKQEWVHIRRAFFCKLDVLEDELQYALRVSAYMDEMDMPGITDKVNLMSYWNRIRPAHISEPFMLRNLEQ